MENAPGSRKSRSRTRGFRASRLIPRRAPSTAARHTKTSPADKRNRILASTHHLQRTLPPRDTCDTGCMPHTMPHTMHRCHHSLGTSIADRPPRLSIGIAMMTQQLAETELCAAFIRVAAPSRSRSARRANILPCGAGAEQMVRCESSCGWQGAAPAYLHAPIMGRRAVLLGSAARGACPQARMHACMHRASETLPIEAAHTTMATRPKPYPHGIRGCRGHRRHRRGRDAAGDGGQAGGSRGGRASRRAERGAHGSARHAPRLFCVHAVAPAPPSVAVKRRRRSTSACACAVDVSRITRLSWKEESE